MVQKIERDVGRFRQIVRGRIRQDLRKYLSRGELIGKRGSDLVSVPVPRLDIPHFRYGDRGNGGVSSGDGEVGQPVAPGSEAAGRGEAGSEPGAHILEVDLSVDEIARMLAEELELPDLEPRGSANIVEEKSRYTGIRSTGPESLRHFKRTYQRALKRQIASRSYYPLEPKVIPIREDARYRAAKTVLQPRTRAAIIYMMDVSGSMGAEQKEIVRIESFWIDAWLRSQYEGIATAYIVHDAAAREVDQHTFFHTRESGGTRISSAYALCARLVMERYPPSDWNLYALHFSDGDNWGEDDSASLDVLRSQILPAVNLFGYAQVASSFGSGRFIHELEEAFPDVDNVALSEIEDRDAILDSIGALLGKGR